MRKGFSLITAIFIMVLMATLSAFILNLSSKVTKSTTSQFRQEQAALLARSYTELAVLAVINYNRNATDCVEYINGNINGLLPGGPVNGSNNTGSAYFIDTHISYIGDTLPCSEDRKIIDSTDPSMSATTLTTNYNLASPDSIAAIIVDVYVRYRDPSVISANNTIAANTLPWLVYHRRTLQKI